MISLITIVGATGLVVFLVTRWESIFYALRTKIRNSRKPAVEILGKHWEGWQTSHNWLAENNAYYRQLNPACQQVFLARSMEFLRYKKFIYKDLEPNVGIPLLISSAAIQISFGLQDFRLDYFDTIIVSGTPYHVHWHKKAFLGHVNSAGIHLSWDHFLHGYQHYGDGHNLGLHEMAHALTYGALLGKTKMEEGFREKFKKYAEVAYPIMRRMRSGEPGFLDAYAATSFHEFWAVSLETFFEQAQAFNDKEPELYQALCVLLNQNPLQLSELCIGE